MVIEVPAYRIKEIKKQILKYENQLQDTGEKPRNETVLLDMGENIVEVVLCKDCKYKDIEDMGGFFRCRNIGTEMTGWDFCSYGVPTAAYKAQNPDIAHGRPEQ